MVILQLRKKCLGEKLLKAYTGISRCVIDSPIQMCQDAS